VHTFHNQITTTYLQLEQNYLLKLTLLQVFMAQKYSSGNGNMLSARSCWSE